MTGEDCDVALREYLSTPSAGSEFAPAFLFFGRIPRGLLPYVHVEQSRKEAVSAHEKRMSAEKLEPVAEFQVGDRVRVQNMHTKAWDLRGQITGGRPVVCSAH